jgi:hypothetical protein
MKMVADILAKYDPMHLISAGAPIDEYEHEAARIVISVLPNPYLVDINIHCRGIFREAFNPNLMDPDYDWTPVAKEILQVHQ